MAKHGIRFKPEQIVSLLRQIEVLTANGSCGRQRHQVALRTTQQYLQTIFELYCNSSTCYLMVIIVIITIVLLVYFSI